MVNQDSFLQMMQDVGNENPKRMTAVYLNNHIQINTSVLSKHRLILLCLSRQGVHKDKFEEELLTVADCVGVMGKSKSAMRQMLINATANSGMLECTVTIQDCEPNKVVKIFESCAFVRGGVLFKFNDELAGYLLPRVCSPLINAMCFGG